MNRSADDGLHSLADRFRVEARLGRGGSGEVYKAWDTVLQRTVAVKVVRPGKADRQAGERLMREARACARLAHPSIVTIHDMAQLDGGVCIVMEHLEGGGLDSVDGPPSARALEGRLGILVQMLDGLHYAHGRGVVHRDVKPRNVQLLPDGSIKVLDFGIAHIAGTETITASGTFMGTVHYASPEQLRGEETDARTDIYSAGIVAYELLTGRKPFDGDSIGAVVTKVLHEALPDMRGEWCEAVPEVEEIIRTATSKAREDRYVSAEEMREALSAVQAGLREKGAKTALPPRGVVPAPAPTGRIRAKDLAPGDAAARRVSTAFDDAAFQRAGREQAREGPGRRSRAVLAGTIGVAVVGGVLWGWRRRAALAGTIGVAVVGGVLWTGEWRSTGSSEARPPTHSARASDLPVSDAPPAPRAPALETGEDHAGRPPGGQSAEEPDRGAEGIARRATPPRRDTLEADTPVDAVAERSERPLEVAAAFRPTDSATVLYYATVAGAEEDRAAGTGGNAGIRYRVLRREPAGEAVEVDPDTTFRSGERIRFAFEPNVDGFLYVVQRGSTGRWSVLLPHPLIKGGRNAVTAFEQVMIPPEGWFRFDETPGTEQLFLYLSKEPIESLPGGAGRVDRPHSADEHTVSVLAGSVRSRDLVFEKEATPGDGAQAVHAAYVVNQGNALGAVAWTVELLHR